MAFIRLFILVFLISTLLYVVVAWSARARQRERLKLQWRDELRVGDRDRWMREELAKYDRSLQARLILGLYVVPFLFVGAMIYLQNWY
ncbi:MAG: hypothetical protein ACU0DW_14295 [Shimia sp.]